MSQMNRATYLLAGALTVALVGGAGFAVFERQERAGLAEAAKSACGPDSRPVTGAGLPFKLPLSMGLSVLRVDEQGATVVAFASIPGGRADLVDRRDRVLADLEAAGYRVLETDQEVGYEAEAQLAGPHHGTVRVKPLCTGLLEVRYAFEQ